MKITVFGLSITKVIGIFLVLIVIGGIINVFLLQRSVENYCKTFKDEGEKLHKQWAEQAKQNTSQNDDFGKFIGSVSNLAGMPRDLENFFDKLSKVAPEEIEPDVVTLRDAAKKSADIPLNGNLMQGFVSSIMLGLSTGGAQSRVDAYTAKHCNIGTQTNSNSFINSHPTVSIKKEAVNTLSADGIKQDSLKLWEHKQSGIVAILNSELVLIDPSKFTITAKRSLPKTQGRTPGGDLGKSYTLTIHNRSRNITDFDNDYRYIPLQFDSLKNEKGSAIGQIGYYDLSNNTILEIPLPTIPQSHLREGDWDPFINPINRNSILFIRQADSTDAKYNLGYAGYWFAYDFDSKQASPYSGDIDPAVLMPKSYSHASSYSESEKDTGKYEAYFGKIFGGGAYYVWDKSHKSLVKIADSHSPRFNDVSLNSGLTEALGCSPLRLIEATTILCLNGMKLSKIDVSNIINNKTATDDPTSYSYQPGRLHYEIPKPIPISSTSGYSVLYDLVLSPDGETAIVQGDTSLYKVNLGSGETKPMVTLGDGDSLTLLEWR